MIGAVSGTRGDSPDTDKNNALIRGRSSHPGILHVQRGALNNECDQVGVRTSSGYATCAADR